MFTTSQVFVATSPIIFDGDRRSGSPMAGPKPQKRWLSIPIRIAARITVILAIWKKNNIKHTGTPGQTLADLTLSNGKKQHIYAKFSCYSWTCRGFEWFNSMFIYPLLFTRGSGWDEFWIALTGHGRTVSSVFHCSDCSWAFLSSSLSACIKSCNNQRKQQRCIPTKGANRKKQIQKYHEPKCVYLVADTIHLSTKTLQNPSRPTWMVETIANDLLPLQNNASLCWVEP